MPAASGLASASWVDLAGLLIVEGGRRLIIIFIGVSYLVGHILLYMGLMSFLIFLISSVI